MGHDQERRQRDLRRRLSPGSSDARQRARAAVAQALSDPERLNHYLRLFGQLALLLEPLEPCRVEPDALVEALQVAALQAADLPELAEEERPVALRRAVAARIASVERLDRCAAAIEAAQRQTNEQDALLALTAGAILLTSCREAGAGPDHPFWDVLFEVSLSEAVLSGHVLTHLVTESLEVDPAATAKAFARALAQEELSRELGALGLDDPAPARLAQVHAELVRSEHPYHLQLDALLHLARAHVRSAGALLAKVAREGLSPPVREWTREVYEEAYTRDVGEGLGQELRRWFAARLEALRDDPEALAPRLPHPVEVERERCLAASLGLAALPREADPLLRAFHVQSLERVRRQAPELEAGFVTKLWNEPEDRFTLEQYERFLLDKREVNRSRRVRDYLATVRSEAAAEKVAGGEAPGGGA